MKNKLDIIFLLPNFSGGGAERVTLILLKGLYNRGYLVGIIVFNKAGPLISMVPKEVPIYSLDKINLRCSIIQLVRKIQHLKPRVLFSTFGYINVTILSMRFILPRKMKIWIREANLPSISLPNNYWPRVMKFLYRMLYKGADKLICTSIRMQNEFIINFSTPKEIIDILPNPVDTYAIQKSSFPVRRFDNGGICYIAAGRMTFQKGFDRLLQWFFEVENKKSTLIILGSGDLKIKLKRKSELLNIQDRVRFIGFCDNPWQWYSGADVFLLSSRWEGMPNSVLEALACATPVISTEESGGIKEITNNDSIVNVVNKKQFVDAMNKAKVKGNASKSVSLLPERYRLNCVISIVEKWIKI